MQEYINEVASYVITTNIIEVDDTGIHYCKQCLGAQSVQHVIEHKPGCVVAKAQILTTESIFN